MVTKEVLSQYIDLQEEIKEVQQKIKKLESDIRKIESDGNVVDSVSLNIFVLKDFLIQSTAENERYFIQEKPLYSF